jgi:hypothetical protein
MRVPYDLSKKNYVRMKNFVKQSIILSVLMFFLGFSLSAQNSKPAARFKRANSAETGLIQKKQFAPSANPKAYERILREKRTGLSGLKDDGKSLLFQENAATGRPGTFRHWETGKAPEKQSPVYNSGNLRVVKSANEDEATVSLNVVGDPYGDGGGYQILLDADHAMPIGQDLFSISYFELNDMSEYSIPVDANVDLYHPLTVLDEKVSITVPEGTYDFLVTNYSPFDALFYICTWYENGQYTDTPAAGDDFFFKAGYEYIFTADYYGYIKYEPDFDAALTQLILPPSSPDLTDSESISVVLSNPGKQPISSVTLSYRIDDGETVTETVTETLNPGAEVTYTFNTKADLSTIGIYAVTAWLDYEGDMKPSNNRQSGKVKHSGPMNLPFICRFDTESDLSVFWEVLDFNSFAAEYDVMNSDADGGVGSLQMRITYVDQQADGYLISSDPFVFPEAGTYHLTFQAYTHGNEKLSVLLGPSMEYIDDLTVLADYNMAWTMGWSLYILNIEVQEAGSYYLAFHYNSDWMEGGTGLNLDNIVVAPGRYVGIPDLSFTQLSVPASSCELTGNAVLGATILNSGTEPVSEFTLTYTVNEGQAVSQTFNETIGVNESKKVFFTQPLDFSARGGYEIQMAVSTPGEENLSNNEKSAIVSHYDPVTDLPFESNFTNPADREDWTSTIANGWGVNEGWKCVFPYERNPLLSRCLTLQPGDYRFTYYYSAGLIWWDGVHTDDFYVAYGRSGTNPSGWAKVKEYKNKSTGGAGFTEEDDIILHITEPGEYVVGVFPVVIGDLALYKTSITAVEEHDVRISKVESPFSFVRKTPKKQVADEHVFNVIVQNRGTHAETGSVEVKLNNVSLATANFTLPATTGEKLIVPLSITFPVQPAGSLDLEFNASTESTDLYPADNSLLVTKIVSDSTFVWDKADDDFQNYTGLNDAGAFGLIYELKKKDVLTSINIALAGYNDRFGIAVYPVDDDLILGDPYFDLEASHDGGSSIAFDVPDTELEPGKYYFAAKQLTTNSIYMVYDADPNGHFYIDDGRGILELIGSEEGLGFIHVRPNFGKMSGSAIPEVKATDLALQLYPNPVVDVLLVRTAGQQIENISVYNASGMTVHREQGINRSEYRLNTAHLASGLYFITVQTPSGVKTDKFVVKN